VAAAIAAADDAVELAATWSLAGPDAVTFDALVDAVHGGPVPKVHVDGNGGVVPGGPLGDDGRPSGAEGGATRRPSAGLTPAQLGVLALDSLPDPGLPAPPGLVPTPLAEALAGSAARSGRGLPARLDG
jgi:hypothetical protein